MASAGGSGDVTKIGTPTNNQLAVWTDSDSIEGSSDLIWDGNGLTTTGQIYANRTSGIGVRINTAGSSSQISFTVANQAYGEMRGVSNKLYLGTNNGIDLQLRSGGAVAVEIDETTQTFNYQGNDLTNTGSIQASGHISYQTGIEAKTANYTMTNADNGKILQVTGNRTISVPASGISAGWTIMIVNEGTGTVTINDNGQTINSKGSMNPLLENQWGGCTIYYDGTNFTAIGDLT